MNNRKNKKLDKRQINKISSLILADNESNKNFNYGKFTKMLKVFFEKVCHKIRNYFIKSEEESLTLVDTVSLFRGIIDEVSYSVIVLDKETQEIMYINKVAKTKFYNPKTNLFICGRYTCDLYNRIVNDLGNDNCVWEHYCSLAKTISRVRSVKLNFDNRDLFVYYLEDVTVINMEQSRIEKLAYFDELTNCFNRRYFLSSVQSMFLRDNGFVLCLMDMNELKICNDNFGHTEGDTYIQTVVEEINKEFKLPEIVSRIGGDEFTIITEMKSEDEVLEALERVNEMLLERSIKQNTYFMSISFGIIYVECGSVIDYIGAMEIADRKMYEHKKKIKLRNNTIRKP